ncbi:DUF2189 domain-containing protein [Paludibacterium yongneupense]|uniref:DUF2189 domain-containing protein n=1 Tax=Paludibacterium yongneupense TaxID=400061 RepID=UPI0004017823|nr:DUF2189 domain-containing protein [Paludibacterium yongneupense]
MDIVHPLPQRVHIHRVGPAHIRRWFRLAERDLRRVPADALFYGVLFVLMGFSLTLYYNDDPEIVLALVMTFLLGGPFLATGLYDLSRQMEAFEGRGKVKLLKSLVAWRSNLSGFSLYGVLLTVIVFGWFRLSLLIFALFYDTDAVPSLDVLLENALSLSHWAFLLAYFGSGFVVAFLVFAVSVIALPMLRDKEVDAVTAMVTSVQAVYQNLATMSLWAFVIVVLTVLGLASYFVALLVFMPLIGMATWYAYRDIITYDY